MFDKGDKVMTPHGVGTVCYKRMKSPDYAEASAYCILLDSVDISRPYNTTIYPAEDVKEVS